MPSKSNSLVDILFYSSDIDLKFAMTIHALICIVIGFASFVVPHGFISAYGTYNHMAHEFVRLYGCLTLGLGWFVWSTKSIKDGRLMRAVSETFCFCYILQALTMLRAQFTDSNGHSLLHWLIAILFLATGVLYGSIRFGRKLKGFELPGSEDE